MSEFGEAEIDVKLSSGLLEPPILVRLACGNRSQNFIHEVFRAAQSKFFVGLMVAVADNL